GCIPSKALLESSELYEQASTSFASRGIRVGKLSLDLPAMLKQKADVASTLGRGLDGLLKKHKIARILGTASITAPGKVAVATAEGTQELTAKTILIATGSTPSSLPGIELDYDLIGTSTEALT